MNAYMRGKTATQTNSARLATIARTHTSGLCALGLALVPAYASAQQTAGQSARGALESGDIIVTAQKREERLRDVPVPVTAVSASTLIDQNQTRAQDFFSNVPGVNVQFQNNRARLTIRGITTSPVTGNPVIGYTVDDAPYGSSTGQSGLFGSAPDLDPSDLERIEVLRGPQGTLYGASSIGGLVKYITTDPDLKEVRGTVAVGTNTIRGAGQALGYNVRGAINLPLGETFAIRASAFTRHDPGYIDNVVSGEKNVNSGTATGGRLSALWKPSETFSVKLGALYQNRDVFGSSNVDPRLGFGSGFLQADEIGAGHGNGKQQQYSAVINAGFGGVDLTSVTAYSRSTNYDLVDNTASGLTGFLFPLVYPQANGEFGNVLRKGYGLKKFSQEMRLAGSVGGAFDWIVGGFYTHEKIDYTLHPNATNPNTGAVYGIPLIWVDDLTFKEYAVFGNMTARLSDTFDVQFGARYSKNRQTLTHREWITFAPDSEYAYSIVSPRSKGNSFTFQVTPRLKLSVDHMIYARLATGYRPGGPNAVCDPGVLPCQFDPDKVINYELGAKGELLGQALSYDLSLYNIDWKDIQITQRIGAFSFGTNGGKARSRGVEIALESRPVDGLTLAVWGAYNDAILRESFVTSLLYTAKGDRLPFSSRYSGRFSFNYEAPLTGEATGSIGASVAYIGNRKGEFVDTEQTAPLRQTYPSYMEVGMTAGVKWDDWKVSFFVQNLTNRRGVAGGGYLNQTSQNPNWFYYIQPRTVGLSIEKQF
ncbi:TonB-dependent receptor [soil metagenome]